MNLAEFAFVGVNSIFGPMLLFSEGICFRSPIQIQGLTLVNFSITKLSDAQRARLNLW